MSYHFHDLPYLVKRALTLSDEMHLDKAIIEAWQDRAGGQENEFHQHLQAIGYDQSPPFKFAHYANEAWALRRQIDEVSWGPICYDAAQDPGVFSRALYDELVLENFWPKGIKPSKLYIPAEDYARIKSWQGGRILQFGPPRLEMIPAVGLTSYFLRDDNDLPPGKKFIVLAVSDNWTSLLGAY